jgi:glycosyltransferase involved in cell wall biosynthesis
MGTWNFDSVYFQFRFGQNVGVSNVKGKLGVVIPTKNEVNRIRKVIPNLKKEFKDVLIIVVDDLSKDRTAEVAKELGAFVPYHKKKFGYGRSLYEGLCLAWFTFDCDWVMEMDADHPVEEIKKFLNLKKTKRFVVVGYEKDEWKLPRTVTAFLVRKILRFQEVRHPTCGFILWSKKILKDIPWKSVKSNGDASHIELLYWASRRGAVFHEVEFSGHEGERNYGIGRIVSWWFSFLRLLGLRWLWWWM